MGPSGGALVDLRRSAAGVGLLRGLLGDGGGAYASPFVILSGAKELLSAAGAA